MLLTTSDNKLQFKSPIRYSSEFSASILSIILSKVEKRSGDDCGGLYQVVMRKGSEPAGFRGFNSEIFKIIRTKISKGQLSIKGVVRRYSIIYTFHKLKHIFVLLRVAN